MSIQELPITSAERPSLPIPVHRFSVDEYHRLAESGFFAPDARVELLDGWIVDMTPIGTSHRFTVQQIYRIILNQLPAGWDAFMQQPITLSTSEPESDVSVIRGSNADYKQRHPGPADVGLIIEVADSSVTIDQEKIRIYAEAGIPRYWIIDLVKRAVECHSLPVPRRGKQAATYDQREFIDAGGSLALILDGREVATIKVADVLP